MPGTLKVTELTDKVTVTITENSGSEKYDGTEKKVTGYTVTSISNELYTEDDFEFVGDESALTVTGTDAGSYPMELKASDFKNNSKNFSNVEFVIVDGTLLRRREGLRRHRPDQGRGQGHRRRLRRRRGRHLHRDRHADARW